MIEQQLYDVNDLYLAVQGEGCLSGVPMLLIRLHGCAVGCHFCDTKETWHPDLKNKSNMPADLASWMGRNHRWAKIDAWSLARLARNVAGERISWVLLTGGEPAQQKLAQLIEELHERGFKVALETSGTADGLIGAGADWVCISPKINNPGKLPILRAVLALANEIKFVIGKPRDVDLLKSFIDEHGDVCGAALPLNESCEWCIQPISQSQSATELCLELAKREGFRLSIQLHKYIIADGADRHGAALRETE